ncbi:MAG: acyltransferase, partial [Acidimicrobiales bacterium]|nr:acyltransferase [Acidimicrobiales bacterium]
MQTNERVEIRHIPALDGLRGAAVAGVLLFHGGVLDGGFMGVDLFFVLSGFLITTLLLREWDDTTTISLKRFWFRRARRLLPALFGLLVGVAIYALVVADGFELGAIRADGLAAVAYVANWQQILGGNGYWDVYSAPSPFLHTWSLAIEEQFYVLWPLVFVGVMRWSRSNKRVLLGLALVGAVASAIVMTLVFTEGADPSRAYLGTDTRAGGVLLGASLAIALSVWGTVRTDGARRGLEIVGIGAALALAAVWLTVDGGTPWLYRFGFFACGLLSIAVIAAVVHPRPGVLATALSVAPLRGLGLISYGLYLWHWPIFIAIQRTWRLDGWPLLAVGVPISLGVALASYRWLEQPIRQHGLAAWRRPGLVPVGAMAAVIVLLAATAGGDGREAVAVEIADPAEMAEQFDTLPDFSGDAGTTVPATTPVTAAVPEAGTAPILRAPDRPDRVLVVGDSVAGELAKAMTARQDELGLLVADRALYACPLGSESWRIRDDSGIVDDRPACAQYAALWTEAVSTFRPDAVVLLYGGAPLGEREVAGAYLDACDPAFVDWYEVEMTKAIDLLASYGATVFVAPAAPSTSAFFDAEEMARRTACMTEGAVAAVAARPAARLLRLDQWTCPPDGIEVADVPTTDPTEPLGECRLDADGVDLRPDGIHFEGPGADLAVDWT